MKLADMKGIFHSDTLTLKASENPFGDYWIFDFDAGENTWITGEHALFTVPGEYKWKKWRAMSIASNHEEGIVKIGTRISDTPSTYKTALKNLKVWDEVKMRGPFGWFKLQDDTSPVIMIAGGIWITPFRALIDRLHDAHREIVLLYSSRDWYLFKDEFDEISWQNPNIKIHYISGRDELKDFTDRYAQKHRNNADYFISGLPKMIASVKKNLKSHWIKGNNIFNDSFYGY